MSDILQGLSNALAEVTDTVGASVVRVEARRRLPATGVVWSAEGVIVTSNHVVERDDDLKIGLPDGSTVGAKLAGRDPSTDLAVLRAQASGLTVPAWVEPHELRVGHLALALGRPGSNVMATLGVIAALDDGAKMPAGMQIDTYLQSDVTMYPGFSGGPLVTADGRVAGLNSSALMRGVSLAVPVPTLRRVVEALMMHGKMKRGYLGVGAQSVRLPSALAAQLGQDMGLLIVSVEADSPAEKGGLYLGDTIISLEGRALREPDDLIKMLSGDMVGKRVGLRIVRGGQTQEVSVTVGERPSKER